MKSSHRRGIEFWRPTIDGQRSSGLAVAAYCRKHGISECSFYNWRRRLRQPAQGKVAPAAPFVELKSPISSSSGSIEICLSGQRRLLVQRGFDRDLLVELIRTLEGEPSRLEGMS
jgi:transposase-like protein